MKTRFNVVVFCFLSMIISSCNKSSTDSCSTTDENAPLKECKSLFADARKCQMNGKYDDAMTLYKRCITYHSDNVAIKDSLSPLVVNSMLQLMNSYQACGKITECVEYFRSLYYHPKTFMIRKYFMRDLCSIYAYALYRNDNMDEAMDMIRNALTMHYDNPTHERLFRDYSYATVIFYGDSKHQKLVVHYGLKALKEVEYCKHTSGAQWLITVLANIYDRRGEIAKAVALHERAIKVAKEKNDTLGLAHAYIALSSIYIEWRLPSYANDYASIAINKIKGINKYPDIVASLYVSKATALKELSRYDSMFIYLSEAKSLCKKFPYHNGMSSIECLEGIASVERCNGDSLLNGISILNNVVKNGDIYNKAIAFFNLAKAYLKIGDNRKGEAMLDSMYNMLHNSAVPYYISGAYLFAIKHYIRQNDTENIIKYGKALALENEFNQDKQTSKKLANLIVQINMEKKEQLLSNYRIKIENYSLLIAIFMAVILLAIPIISYRKKLYKAKNSLMEEKLNKLLDKLEYEKKYIRETEEKLSSLLSDKQRRRDIVNTSADTLADDGEDVFRERFDLLYPTFISQLRMKAPTISHKDELFCMLIALGQDSYQIERLLNIAHRSVIMARYRIKQKLQLDNDINIDDVIKDMLAGDEKPINQ